VALANGAFEENEEEVPAVVEEFYSEGDGGDSGREGCNAAESGRETVSAKKLNDKLAAKTGKTGEQAVA
jgi:hypothetical protein